MSVSASQIRARVAAAIETALAGDGFVASPHFLEDLGRDVRPDSHRAWSVSLGRQDVAAGRQHGRVPAATRVSVGLVTFPPVDDRHGGLGAAYDDLDRVIAAVLTADKTDGLQLDYTGVDSRTVLETGHVLQVATFDARHTQELA